ncbi:MAG: hypothetical protein JST82_00910 [Bacteroidetes bacterium]|nr:hypothetical protein [Bacteroidota bacterium]
MKNLFKIACVALCASTLVLNSCKKEEDEGKLPNISFKTGTGYTSADATVAKSSSVKIGINASKAEDKDVLTKFTITRSYDGGSDSTMYTKDLSGGEGDSYSYDYSFNVNATGKSEKYTFTVVNRDGLINKVSLNLTVN